MPDYVLEVAPGLWRWTAPHPEWRPGAEPGSPADWGQIVGSVLYRTPEAATFIDPLLPPDPEPFWAWADARAAERRVSVLTTLKWHRRSREDFAARYGAATSRAKPSLPPRVESVVLRRAGETVFWLPEHRALIPGDRVLGADNGGLRLCPESWLHYLGTGIKLEGLREQLRPLLELPIERVLVSHGEPVLRGGRKALAQALAA